MTTLRRLLVAIVILSTHAASADPSGFWDAVYKTTAADDSPKCSIDSGAPTGCDRPGPVAPQCLRYLSWEGPDTLICPSLCGNGSRLSIAGGVVKLDVDYVGPAQGGHAGDPDHYADRTKTTRHVEVSVAKGKVSTSYANSKRYVEIDQTVPLASAIVGGHRDGATVHEVTFDRIRIKTSLSQNAGRCEGNSTAATGRDGLIELELVARNHHSGEDINVGCKALLYGPDYKKGNDCDNAPTYSGGDSSSSSSSSSHGGGKTACKSQCRDAAYQCRKACRSDASCQRQCGGSENACQRGC